jgi:ribosomal protein L7/L12
MQDSVSLSKQCENLLAAGKSQDEIILFLRTQGCSKVESIAVLANSLGIGLGQAKKVVHLSVVWADTRERDEKIQTSLEEEAGK